MSVVVLPFDGLVTCTECTPPLAHSCWYKLLQPLDPQKDHARWENEWLDNHKGKDPPNHLFTDVEGFE